MANQTIIEAVKAAYTPHKVDYTPVIQSMANMSQTLSDMRKDASDKVNELDKSFNAIDFLGQKEMELFAYDVRNDQSLTHTEKMSKMAEFKNSMNILEEWSGKVGELYENQGALLSGAMSGEQLSWHTSLLTGKYYGANSIQDLNRDGVISEDEAKLKPIKFDQGKLKILNWDGTYITTKELKKNFPKKTDSDGIFKSINNAKKLPSKFNKNDINNHVNNKSDEIRVLIDSDPAALNSFIYDKPLRIDRDDPITFVEYFLENYDADNPESEIIANELTRIGKEELDAEAIKILNNELFKQIIAVEKTDVKKELIDFIKEHLKYNIKGQL
jgi:hypothetical protein